jgi:hypothetical protein
MSCKNKCRFEKKASKWTYSEGKLMCTVCEVSLDTKELRCYCCHHVLRRGPQTNKYRQLRSANAVRL